jgi:hypothetical protein
MILLDSHGTDGSTQLLWASLVKQYGQSIRLDKSVYIMQVNLRLSKVGSPTGTAYSHIYSHSGVFGAAGSVPVGSPLATSDPLDISTLTGSAVETELVFDTPYLLPSNTPIFIVLESNNGDVSNRVVIDANITDLSHPGVSASYISSWATNTGLDMAFELFGTYSNPTIQGVQSITGLQSITF